MDDFDALPWASEEDAAKWLQSLMYAGGAWSRYTKDGKREFVDIHSVLVKPNPS